jgi:hypothetical protein
MEEQPVYWWHISVESAPNVWTYSHDAQKAWPDEISAYLSELQVADETSRSYSATWFEPAE